MKQLFVVKFDKKDGGKKRVLEFMSDNFDTAIEWARKQQLEDEKGFGLKRLA